MVADHRPQITRISLIHTPWITSHRSHGSHTEPHAMDHRPQITRISQSHTPSITGHRSHGSHRATRHRSQATDHTDLTEPHAMDHKPQITRISQSHTPWITGHRSHGSHRATRPWITGHRSHGSHRATRHGSQATDHTDLTDPHATHHAVPRAHGSHGLAHGSLWFLARPDTCFLCRGSVSYRRLGLYSQGGKTVERVADHQSFELGLAAKI